MRHCVLALFILTVGHFACKNIKTERPPCEDQYDVIPQDTSFLSTPLVISLQLIEDKLNESIERDIVDDDNFDNANKEGKADKLKLKITRLGNIKVVWKNNVASYQMPLHVLVERQIVNKRLLPLSNSIALKTEFSLLLAFETTLSVGEDWKLQPQTKFTSFQWLSDVTILGGLIDLTKMIERRLVRQMPEVLEKIDEKIRSSVHLDRGITRVWWNIQKPMIINRKAELIWLKIHPIQFEMGTITTEDSNLMIQGRLSATTETLVGDHPAYTIDSTLPPLVKRQALPNEAYVYMLSEISYDELNKIISKKLDNNVFKVANHNVKIKSAEIWGCGNNLVLHIRVRGDVKGDIYFQGQPRYDPDSLRIAIKNFDFEVVTEEALLASTDWLLHSNFKEQIQNALSVPLAEQIVKIPDAIIRGIERGRAGKKIELTIEEWDFKPQKIWVRPSGIAVLIIVNAQVRLELETLGK